MFSSFMLLSLILIHVCPPLHSFYDLTGQLNGSLSLNCSLSHTCAHVHAHTQVRLDFLTKYVMVLLGERVGYFMHCCGIKLS